MLVVARHVQTTHPLTTSGTQCCFSGAAAVDELVASAKESVMVVVFFCVCVSLVLARSVGRDIRYYTL